MSASLETSKGQGLFPGYKQVEGFGPDEDYDDELEECYVTLDLGSVDQTLVPNSAAYRLIGLDTPNPLLQISGTIMRGYHRTLIGTELIFKDATDESELPSQSDIQYFTSTDRRIVFREVELKPKSAEPTSQQTPRKKKYAFSLPYISATDAKEAQNNEGPSTSIPQCVEMTEVTDASPTIERDFSVSEGSRFLEFRLKQASEVQEDQNMDVDK
ncbi:uncharacterized protein FOMMEDRAFT_159005 [Fomitiporia mediterranea MF3/22]|uniref:uncharacterized protein n=1 Tax=Fomitiporia mediterranea (strain MF3/22) TaxID=694068 RepID=UPI0004408FEA|nr:uncharacterized protein FOMMEDRAFT_159005 [Fomitiporia mediterranea MF3/22]EJD00331.1 hypothetical protein FOMMEDRAFT_159005 [Fomitiporia mediterranea MF3/22]